MPLDYNNVKKPWFSETYREFSPAQDWTANGVKTLVLYFQGRTVNTPEKLYVAFEDTYGKAAAVAYTNGTTVSAWTEWKIPLSQFLGPNVAQVKRMYIGVGDRDRPTMDGSGRLYIDDIRLTK